MSACGVRGGGEREGGGGEEGGISTSFWGGIEGKEFHMVFICCHHGGEVGGISTSFVLGNRGQGLSYVFHLLSSWSTVSRALRVLSRGPNELYGAIRVRDILGISFACR